MATYSSLNNSWQQLYTKGNNMKVPERELLTRSGVYLKKRPEPEVVEHMLDELETKMRNYFILYNREREFRKKSEENCYRLEQEVLNYKQKLEESNNKFHCMERKVKSMVDQPLKLKETIERIELLYNQMDTLIQAFVGIGSCAVIQGYSRVAFIKLCLEYLYPCRELDIRLNTLYNALYSVLIQYDGLEVTKNELLKPMTYQETQEKTKLTGISVKVHRLMLKCDLPETQSFGCFFRYDNEPKELRATEFSRFISVGVKPMDNASKVYEFNSLIQHNTLPPKVPNVVPKLVLDIYADSLLVGSAEVSLISDKTLKPSEPWNVLDSNGMNCGDVVVTVIPMPQDAKLPAVNFRNKTDELVSETKTTLDQQIRKPGSTMGEIAEPTRPNTDLGKQPETTPQTSKASEPKSEQNKPFEPKTTPAVRKPLFNPKAGAPGKQGQSKGQAKGSSSNVSRLSLMFARKKNNQQGEETSETPDGNAPTPEAATSQQAPPAPKDTQNGSSQPAKAETVERKPSSKLLPPELPNSDRDVNELQRQRTNIKDMIIKKLSSRQLSKDSMTEEQPKPSAPQPKAETTSTGQTKQEKAEDTPPKPVEEPEGTQESPEPKQKSAPQQSQPVMEQPSPTPVQPAPPAPPAPPAAAPTVPTKAAKLPPEPVRKAVPKMPLSQPVVETQKEPGDQLPEKPLVPITITPKLLKKPAPKKK
ncbi:conserved hypothetical protein [Theileria orientalis strain Shintoku]|uniref:Uncharacterized protein n=1 Tax=Theileria orientalis strain Shintoku TaxID=869250 RepID=J4CCV0_THEOR|nr:conserved hypothetical protein [Theileria orientalis strain Shintoku]BAM40027.1 conserved hypothetical protein [Theileria orientalis strain Shintoku]|eukprot:XP_009690328.1 conserved hypothetical protein [Theileria orientalis strain Shintoku]